MTQKDDNQIHPDDEIVTISDDGATAETKKPKPETERKGADEEDGEDAGHDDADGDEEDLRHGRHADEDDEARRSKRRDARRARKNNRREREAAKDAELQGMRQELDALRGQVGTVAQSTANQTLAIVDGRLSEANQAKELADAAMADAMTKQDAKGVQDALKARDIASAAITQLTDYKARFVASQRTQANAQTQPGGPSAAMISLARQFKADNPWVEFDTNAADGDSQAVHRLDASVKAAGYDPNTPEYWEELQDRVDRKFPAKLRAAAGDDDDDQDTGGATQRSAQQQRSNGRRGPAMTGGRSMSGLGKNDVVIPKEVKKAAQEAGYWNDPKERADFIKRWKASKEKYGQA